MKMNMRLELVPAVNAAASGKGSAGQSPVPPGSKTDSRAEGSRDDTIDEGFPNQGHC